jgi:hypothetical protein
MLEMGEIDARRILELPVGVRAFLYAAVEVRQEAEAEVRTKAGKTTPQQPQSRARAPRRSRR